MRAAGASQLVGGASIGHGGTMLRSLRRVTVNVGAYGSPDEEVGAVRFWVRIMHGLQNFSSCKNVAFRQNDDLVRCIVRSR